MALFADEPRAANGATARAQRVRRLRGRVWLNTAHQGPLPLAAGAAAAQANELKQFPHRIADADFTEVPERLRALLGRLVGADPARDRARRQHLPRDPPDRQRTAPRPRRQVLVVASDYPATVLPWLRLRDQGVTVREVRPAGPVLSADDVEAAISDRSRVLALTWVNSSPATPSISTPSAPSASRAVALVVNASQAIGARPFEPQRPQPTPSSRADTSGSADRMGPATWLRPSLGAQLRPQHAYWLAMQAGRPSTMRDSTIRHDLGVHAFDRFCPADSSTRCPGLPRWS